jgi:hypothetical protein
MTRMTRRVGFNRGGVETALVLAAAASAELIHALALTGVIPDASSARPREARNGKMPVR